MLLYLCFLHSRHPELGGTYAFGDDSGVHPEVQPSPSLITAVLHRRCPPKKQAGAEDLPVLSLGQLDALRG